MPFITSARGILISFAFPPIFPALRLPPYLLQDRIKYLEGLLETHENQNMTYEMVRCTLVTRLRWCAWCLTFSGTSAQRLFVANLGVFCDVALCAEDDRERFATFYFSLGVIFPARRRIIPVLLPSCRMRVGVGVAVYPNACKADRRVSHGEHTGCTFV